MQGFRVDLKTFLGLTMPNQSCHAVRKYIFGGFLVEFFGKKPQTLRIPMYSTAVLYDCVLSTDTHQAFCTQMFSFCTQATYILFFIRQCFRYL